MDLLGDPLTTHPIQMGWEISIEPYPNWRFGWIDNADCQFVNYSVLTWTGTRSDCLEQLLTLTMPHWLTSQHLTPHPNHTKLYRRPLSVIPHHPHTSWRCQHSVTPLPFAFFRTSPPHISSSHPPPAPWQYPPLRIDVLQEHSLLVLAFVGIIGETPPLIVGDPPTEQVPRSRNHNPSFVPNIHFGYEISDYLQHLLPDTPSHHQPLLEEGDQLVVQPKDHRPPDPAAKHIVLDEFIITLAASTHKHMVIFYGVFWTGLTAASPAFEWVG